MFEAEVSRSDGGLVCRKGKSVAKRSSRQFVNSSTRQIVVLSKMSGSFQQCMYTSLSIKILFNLRFSAVAARRAWTNCEQKSLHLVTRDVVGCFELREVTETSLII